MIYREPKYRSYDGNSKKMKKVVKLDWDRNVMAREIDSDDEVEEICPMNGTNLMQFTGLKDKNGKEIYEGDIFDCIYKEDGCNHKSVIVWRISDARFILRACGECDQPNVTQTFSDAQGHEVIGNTSENPELLEIAETTGREGK